MNGDGHRSRSRLAILHRWSDRARDEGSRGHLNDDLAPGTLRIVLKASESGVIRFLVIIEETETGYSAYSPDLPGCVSTGTTSEDARRNMHQAIELHIEGLRAE